MWKTGPIPSPCSRKSLPSWAVVLALRTGKVQKSCCKTQLIPHQNLPYPQLALVLQSPSLLSDVVLVDVS